MSAFDDHLKHASETVATWPEWKRNVLGGTMTKSKTVLETPDSFAVRVKAWLKEMDSIKADIGKHGQAMIVFMCKSNDAPLSLRELARRSLLSPTYLSRAMNGEVVLSPAAYVKVYSEYRNVTGDNF